MFDSKYENASKVINELKEKHLEAVTVETYVRDEPTVVKCKSTDCLHRYMNKNLMKCPSETTLADGVPDNGYVKSSWEEIKQAIKQKKNKLKINRPVRGTDVLGAFHCDTPLETVSTYIVLDTGIIHTINQTEWQYTFVYIHVIIYYRIIV